MSPVPYTWAHFRLKFSSKSGFVKLTLYSPPLGILAPPYGEPTKYGGIWGFPETRPPYGETTRKYGDILQKYGGIWDLKSPIWGDFGDFGVGFLASVRVWPSKTPRNRAFRDFRAGSG